MTAALASGYHGPPELTLLGAFTQWSADPWALGLVLLLGGLYLAGVRRVRRTRSRSTRSLTPPTPRLAAAAMCLTGPGGSLTRDSSAGSGRSTKARTSAGSPTAAGRS